MFNALFYWTLLALVVGLSLWRGDRDARTAAIICLLASVGSLYQLSPTGSVAMPIHHSVALVDVVTLLVFLRLALRSEHFWPLWVAGLQLTTTMSHFLRMLYPALLDVAYDAAMQLWSYPLLLILGVAAWQSGNRHSDLPGSAAHHDEEAGQREGSR